MCWIAWLLLTGWHKKFRHQFQVICTILPRIILTSYNKCERNSLLWPQNRKILQHGKSTLWMDVSILNNYRTCDRCTFSAQKAIKYIHIWKLSSFGVSGHTVWVAVQYQFHAICLTWGIEIHWMNHKTRAVSDCLIRPLPASVNALLVNCS